MAKTHPLDDGFARTASKGADGALDRTRQQHLADRQMLRETVGPRMLAPPSEAALQQLRKQGRADRQLLEETVGPRMTTPPPRPPLRETSPARQAAIEANNRARNTHLLRPAPPGVPRLLPNAPDGPAEIRRRYRRRVRAQGGEIA